MTRGPQQQQQQHQNEQDEEHEDEAGVDERAIAEVENERQISLT